ncbi:MAG TPA: hypothetical protein PKY31_07865 [Spirochaetota bacterium]|nr:hypothetical protein [Spirochaetota bacterium]
MKGAMRNARAHSWRMIPAVLLALTLVVVHAAPLRSQEAPARGKVLVLGFASQYINDVQDMLLREAVMRSFRKTGYSVVPVMELEDYIQENGLNVRSVNRASLKSLCREFKTDYSLAGSIDMRRRKLFVSLSLYQKDGDQYYSFIIPMGRTSDFQNYCPGLARDIVRKADVVIRGNLK